MIRVKVCGITNLRDAMTAVDAGADALGFIFVEKTPRFVTPEQATPIIRRLPPFVTPVGVFWDHSAGHVKAVSEACGLRALQFHGQETPEDLADYMKEMGLKVNYIHSDIDTLERIEILRDLRLGTFDVLVGINLLREGLDLPEVAFIGILDADKEGYLRAFRSFIQIIGRAARNVEGKVIMYADRVTDSMRSAIDETERRRNLQLAYNIEHGITPATVKKAIYNLEIEKHEIATEAVELMATAGLPREDVLAIIRDLEKEMKRLSRELAFEDAARVRDKIIALRKRVAGDGPAEDDADVALAVALTPKPKSPARNWRRTRRGP